MSVCPVVKLSVRVRTSSPVFRVICSCISESSLVRHLKLCTRVKSASLRQKSCQQCAGAKAKCNLRRPTCSRCTSRGVPCTYTSGSSESDGAFEPTTPDLFSVGTMYPPGGPDMDTMLDGFDQDIMNDVLTQGFDNNPSFSDTLARWSAPEDYSKTVACAPEFVRLENPWISTLLLPSTETPDGTPELAKHSMQSLLRAMRTWPRILCKGLQMPPVFHHSVVENKDIPLPLANCCTLVHMWDRQYKGTSSIVQDTILKEIKTIFENVRFSFTQASPDIKPLTQTVQNLQRARLPRRPPSSNNVRHHALLPLEIPVRHTLPRSLPLRFHPSHRANDRHERASPPRRKRALHALLGVLDPHHVQAESSVRVVSAALELLRVSSLAEL